MKKKEDDLKKWNKMEDDLQKERNARRSKQIKMENEPINQNQPNWL